MRSATIVVIEERRQIGLGGRNSVVGFQIHLFIFHRPPEPFNEDIVAPATLAVHADSDAVFLQHACKFGAGELAALIGIEDFRR